MITPYNKGIVTKELLLSPFHTDSFIAVTSPFLSAFSKWKSRFFCLREGRLFGEKEIEAGKKYKSSKNIHPNSKGILPSF
ncbi:MAG: hypothetical protein SO147_00925 [Clostridia bacterium]|nr:hypothetical protein [Clostridia bacterium]